MSFLADTNSVSRIDQSADAPQSGHMSFLARMTRSPRPYDLDRAADTLADYADQPDQLAKFLAGVAGCSPYLADLLRREAEWIRSALADPEAAFADLLLDIPNFALTDLPAGLRQAKRRVALLAALADLACVWKLEKVTQALTDFADAAVQAAIVALVADEVRRGRLPASDDPANAGGMVVLAMGKMVAVTQAKILSAGYEHRKVFR